MGILHVDAQLLAISERKVIDGKNETITTPRLSFRFLNVSPAVERELQRIIFRLSATPEKERIKCENNLHAKLHGVQRLLKLPDIARRLRRGMIINNMFKKLVSIQIVNFFYRLLPVG